MNGSSSLFSCNNLPEWCQQKKYLRYWSHYNTTRNCFFRHQDGTSHKNQTDIILANRITCSNAYYSSFWMFYYYSTMKYYQDQYYNLLSQKVAAPQCAEKTQYDVHQKEQLKQCNQKRPKNTSHSTKKKRRMASNKEKTVSGVTDIILDFDPNVLGQEEEVIECHMEITEEMLEFFAQSAKHRMERDAQKEETQNENINDVYIDISRANTGATRATFKAPKERPGAKRTTEMKLLYGKGAPMIHGMETALQLAFDKYLDLKQPTLWPHLPLNIKFD